MRFRIGINLGDVIVEGDRLYGDGVNIAARLESLADGGGICLSGTAYDQIEGKLPFGYEFKGEHSVKNITRPVRVYRLHLDPSAAPGREHAPDRGWSSPSRPPLRSSCFSARRVGRLALAQAVRVCRAPAAGPAFGGRAAVREPESGSVSGVLQRRRHRGPDHRALEGLRSVRDRA
jgi:hypothetical protein